MTKSLNVFQVGGSVRDKLLGLTPKDIDYVVVGSSVEEMLSMGFIQVGKAFPVFIGQDGNEYALARKERKTGTGHCGFGFDVSEISLEDDLLRRDLTINSMALSKDGKLIDPFGGLDDIKNKVLRHTSDAFAEDPLRVLRLARFAAKLPDFTIDPKTIELLKVVTQSDEFKSLTPERVLMEMSGAFKTSRPSRFFEVLKLVGGVEHFLPELAALYDVPQRPEYHPEGDCWVHTMLVLDEARKITNNPVVHFSALVHDLGKGITPKEILPAHHGHEEAGIPLVEAVCRRLKVPGSWKELALIVTKQHLKIHQLKNLRPATVVKMFYDMGAYRKPQLVRELAQCCQADAMGKYKSEADSKSLLEEYFEATNAVSFKDCRPGLTGEKIANEIRQLKVSALKEFIRRKGVINGKED